MRLAVSARLVDFVLPKDENGNYASVAIVKKKPIWTTVSCRLRRRIGWRSSFLLRGGIKLFPVDRIVRFDDKEYHVVAMREMKYGTVMIADRMVSPTTVNFEHPLVLKQGYLIFNVVNAEAKLVADAEPTHVMVVLEHSAYFKRAEIKIIGGNVVTVFNDWMPCGRKSIAMAVVFAPFNSQFTVCYNDVGTKYWCRDIVATVSPAVRREFYA
jgi:hypothetical protein